MKNLCLLRHAKSSWGDANQTDFDRPLNERGLRDAPVMAQRLADQQSLPDFILCSSANRTRQTAEFFLNASSLPSAAIEFHDDLYLASAGTMLDYIQKTSSDVQHLMIIAHNPGLESLGRQLHPNAPTHLATCAVLQFAIHNEHFAIEPTTEVELLMHDYPKNAQ